jgi:hypothetical protein
MIERLHGMACGYCKAARRHVVSKRLGFSCLLRDIHDPLSAGRNRTHNQRWAMCEGLGVAGGSRAVGGIDIPG